jgi:hypothetical protein
MRVDGRGWKILAECACPVSTRVEGEGWEKSTQESVEDAIGFEAIRDKGGRPARLREKLAESLLEEGESRAKRVSDGIARREREGEDEEPRR